VVNIVYTLQILGIDIATTGI